MFSSDTTDKDVQDKLNSVCKVYQLPAVLDTSRAMLESNAKLDNYRKSIFPNNIYSDAFLSERSGPVTQQTPLVIGQSIANNSGVPLNPINKIPSYQWSFKHEDDHKSHHYSHSHHKGKNMLNGLGTSESISLLGGTVMNSTALNSKLIRLPVRNESNKFKERSILNGLPYYDKNIIDKQIRVMNLEKAKLKLPVANASYFTKSFNESVDDVEYLHGEVILNQFLNNKRVMRNYQWMLYYLNRLGGRSLEDCPDLKYANNKVVSVKTIKQFQKWMVKKQEKFKELQKMRLKIAERRKRMRRRQGDGGADRLGEFFSTEGLNDDKDEREDEEEEEEDAEEEAGAVAVPPVGAEELKKEREDEEDDRALEAELPEFEDEVQLSDEEVEDNSDDENEPSSNADRIPPPGNIALPDREIVIEKELSVDDPELIDLQRRLYGIPTSNKLEEQVRQSNGAIQTKRVRVRRVPNPNALGYSNIRHRKPSYL
ncbi:DEKNAAC102980 [Brettanomyces naardenensis]|uniref:DEKNAAC102980 n=1 Tax=Brettanomyces naardenensis TaxID=13370 RepID=A0A448YM06_BRENA|nr:DEKNAAC102980 [Brettanomyces naardenensis]